MALIECPECGKKISEYAEMCIGCGCPMSVVNQLHRSSVRGETITKSISTPQKAKSNKNYTDGEVFHKYNDYYVDIKQDNHFNKTTTIKLYLYGESDYIVQSSSKDIKCPFCNGIVSIRSFNCHRCGHTMYEICKKLYSEWNIQGHRFYITRRAVNDYPENERNREVYKAVRSFVIDSMPYTVTNYFEKMINEVHLSTLVMIYQRGLGIDKVEDGIKEEINEESLRLKKSLTADLTNDSKLKDLAQHELSRAYSNDILVNYEACKRYLAYMVLLNKSLGIKYIKNMVTHKIYGDLDLRNDSIYQTIQITMNDTLVSTDFFHQECDHHCERVYLQIPLLLSNGELIIRTLLGSYCDKCKQYYVLDTEIQKMLCEGTIQAQISFFEAGTPFDGTSLSPESLLRKCGYTVSANINMTKEQRQKILRAIIENNLYTPSKIVAHFRFLISINSNVISRDMSAAIKKWQEDIAFLQQCYS